MPMDGERTGHGVTWKDLHTEFLKRDEAQRRRDELQRERDEAQRNILEEIRDSLGDMHTTLIGLPCTEHEAATKGILVEVADIRAGMLDTRPIKRLIVPTKNPKILIAALTLAGGMLGWDWWPRVKELAEQVTK